MRKIDKPNLSHEVTDNYDLFMYVNDDMGRSWKYMVVPKNCGSIGYFATLQELRVWEKQVVQIHRFERDEPTYEFEMLMLNLRQITER